MPRARRPRHRTVPGSRARYPVRQPPRRTVRRATGGHQVRRLRLPGCSNASSGFFHMLPTIALTMGDPAGIGPEIVLKALADPEVAPLARWIVVGDARILAMLGSL